VPTTLYTFATSTRLLASAVLLLAVGCATDLPRAPDVEAPRAPAARPAADVVADDEPVHVLGAAGGPSDEAPMVLERRSDGWRLGDLLATIAADTDASIELAESVEPGTIEKRVEFLGTLHIPRHRALEWLNAVLGYHGLTMIPTAPPGQERYTVIAVARGLRLPARLDR